MCEQCAIYDVADLEHASRAHTGVSALARRLFRRTIGLQVNHKIFYANNKS